MKFLFEMLFKTFPPSPGVIYFFVTHLTSCQFSRIYFLDGLSDRVSIHKTFQPLPLPTISYAFRALSISKFLLESLSTTLKGMLHSFFINWYPLQILYTEAIFISENQSIERSEVGMYTIIRNGPEKSEQKSWFVNTEKTEFETENRKLENWKAEFRFKVEENQVCYKATPIKGHPSYKATPIKGQPSYKTTPTFIRPLPSKAIPLIRPLPSKATPLIRLDFRCTEIVKCI